MADDLFKESAAAILQEFAAVQKQVGELAIAMEAQRLTLNRLLPGFATQFVAHLTSPSSLRIRQEYEHRISVLLEAHRKISS